MGAKLESYEKTCHDRNNGNPEKRKSFEIDDYVRLKIHPELALALGELVLSTKTENKALLALAHDLVGE